MIHYSSFGQDGINKVFAVKFSGNKTKISKPASITVDSIASTMKSQPNWNYAIGYCVVCDRDGRKNAVNWDRANNIVTRLTTKYGIKAERFIFSYDDYPENCNEVRFRYTEERVSTDAPPHPNLRKKNNAPPCPPDSSSSNY